MLNCLPGQFKHLVSLLPGLSPGILPFAVHLVLVEAQLAKVVLFSLKRSFEFIVR